MTDGTTGWYRRQTQFAYVPLTIGDSVVIDEDSVINAASVGHYVHIGKNVVIVRKCLLFP